jgi:nucleoside-diphosphate-sugar epimerase|tara:strand:+ start:875 stop:1087 length:213 start_codon:yes stop_codon:yes gene_type:complete
MPNKFLKKIQLGNIYTTRDFNYINDAVNGFVAVAKNNKIIGQTINLGNSSEISVKDVVEAVSKITKIKKK